MVLGVGAVAVSEDVLPITAGVFVGAGLGVLPITDAWVVGIKALPGLDTWIVDAGLWDVLAVATAVVLLADAWVVDVGEITVVVASVVCTDILSLVDASVVGTVDEVTIFSDDLLADKGVLLFSDGFVVGDEGEIASPCALEEKAYFSLDS